MELDHNDLTEGEMRQGVGQSRGRRRPSSKARIEIQQPERQRLKKTRYGGAGPTYHEERFLGSASTPKDQKTSQQRNIPISRHDRPLPRTPGPSQRLDYEYWLTDITKKAKQERSGPSTPQPVSRNFLPAPRPTERSLVHRPSITPSEPLSWRAGKNYLEKWQLPVWRPLSPIFYDDHIEFKRAQPHCSFERIKDTKNPSSLALSAISEKSRWVFWGIIRGIYGDDGSESGQIHGENEEVALSYPGGFSLFLILLSGAIPYIVVVLDDAVVAIILPILITEFRAPADIGWYASAYFLPLTALMPIYGKCYALWRIKWTFLFAILIIMIGSIICATAQRSETFITGRVIAGAGAAGIFTGAMRIINLAAPKKHHVVLEAVGCIILGGCTVAGAILGGVIADSIGWRWSFWINVPIGCISAIVFLIVFPKEPIRFKVSNLSLWQKFRRVDVIGASLLIGSLVCLICTLQSVSTSTDISNSARSLAIASGSLLALFLVHEKFRPGYTSLLPHKIFANRTVWSCCLGLFFLFAGFMNFVFFLSIFFQGVLGQTPESSAISMLPYVLSLTAGSAITGLAVKNVRYYNPFFIFGGVMFSTGAGLVFTFDMDITLERRIASEIILGFGVGLLMLANVAACQTSVDEENHSIAQGLTFLCSAAGSTISLPISSTILNRTLRTQIEALELPLSVTAAILLDPTKIQDHVPAEDLLVVLEALVHSIRAVFALGVTCSVLSTLSFYLVPWVPIMA